VAGLFMAGVVPGILLTLGMMAIIHVMAKRRGYPLTGEPVTGAKIFRELRRSWVILLMPVIVIGGIVAGAFTATEGAAVAVVYALVVGMLVTRKLKAQRPARLPVEGGDNHGDRWRTDCVRLSCNVPDHDRPPAARLSFAIRELTSDRMVFNILVAALLFVVGMFLESNAAYIMLVPLFHPIAIDYGLDPLHFGFLFVFNLVLGMLTPPVGVVLFVVCSTPSAIAVILVRSALR
jgi:tripartite ATP-independent transporter DctM subunit